MTTDTCIKEEQIQTHARKLEQLDAHNLYESQRIDDLNKKIEKMDHKLDELLAGFNELKLQSTKDDNNLELRLKAIETKLEANEKAIAENRNKATLQVAIMGLLFSAIMIIISLQPLL